MTLKELTLNYIQKTERVLKELKPVQSNVQSDAKSVKEVIEEAKRYFEDARYYSDRKRFETSLASIAYCEGLLDALRMLGLVQFSW